MIELTHQICTGQAYDFNFKSFPLLTKNWLKLDKKCGRQNVKIRRNWITFRRSCSKFQTVGSLSSVSRIIKKFAEKPCTRCTKFLAKLPILLTCLGHLLIPLIMNIDALVVAFLISPPPRTIDKSVLYSSFPGYIILKKASDLEN